MPRRSRVMSAPDPFVFGTVKRNDSFDNNQGYCVVGSKSSRSLTINGGVRNLVLITAGQSNMASAAPSTFSPSNGTVIDNFNVFNGLNYAAADPLLGSTFHNGLGNGGGVSLRVADLLITNGKFDRVIIVPIAIGGTGIADHRIGGKLYGNIAATMARLASRGITPGMTGVTFAYVWGQGESDNGATSQVTYTAGMNEVLAALFATGFNGRAFVNKQTYISGAQDNNVRAAQVAVVNGTTIFAGADADALTGANRQADSTHFSDAGMSAFATAIYNAMHATGAPY